MLGYFMYKFSLLVGAILGCCPVSVSAEKQTSPSFGQCNELIKECFAYGVTERSTCFYSAGSHTFCRGSDIGRLAMQRWSMSSVRRPGLESAPAFLGPNIVDGDCIANFDARWSALLLDGDTSLATIHDLTTTLKTCSRTTTEDLMRP